MHPILKCCGYYCSCILVASLAFFGILIALISTHNPWLTREFRHDTESRVTALIIAIIVNAICFVLCVGCVMFSRMQDAKEAARIKEEEEGGMGMMKNQ
jgi:uncharacterized membrane protein (DUF485 family)